MLEILKLLIGIAVLGLGFPIGDYLAKQTKEELHDGKKYFKILIIVSAFGALVSLIIKNDYLLFSFSLIAIVTSRSLKKN